MLTDSRFLRDERGSVALMFGILIFVLIGASGLALDFARKENARIELQELADMAALAGAKAMKADRNNAKAVAEKTLKTALKRWTHSKNVKSKAVIDGDRVIVTAETDLDTRLLVVLGIKEMALAVTSVGTTSLGSIDIYVAVDLSASMEIAATAADRKKLMDLSKPLLTGGFAASEPDGCMFACHMGHHEVKTPNGETLYELARAAKIEIREDVVTDAVETMVADLLDEQTNNSIRVGMYAFSNSPRRILEPTSVPFNVEDAFEAFPRSMRDRTHYEDALPFIESDSAALSGSARRLLVLVTDGVYDRYGVGTSELDVGLCDAIKAKGVEILVVEMKYEDLATDTQFRLYVKPFYSKVTPALQKCASPGGFYSATDKKSLDEAMAALREDLRKKAVRLSM